MTTAPTTWHLVPAEPRPQVVDGNSLYNGAPYALNPVPLPPGHPQAGNGPFLAAYPAGGVNREWVVYVRPASTVDFGDSLSESVDFAVVHTYAADGPYTITATSQDEAITQEVLVYARADQPTAPPVLQSLEPTVVRIDLGPQPVTLTGTGFTASSKVRAMFASPTDSATVEYTPQFVSSTELVIQVDGADRTVDDDIAVWVAEPDGRMSVVQNFQWVGPPPPPGLSAQVEGADWLVYVQPPSNLDFGDGQTQDNTTFASHTYVADGPYTITAVAVDASITQTYLVYQRADQASGPPQLTATAPEPIPFGGMVTLTVTGTGFLPTDKVMVSAYGVDVTARAAPTTYVSATQLTCQFDASLAVPTGGVFVWVAQADGKATAYIVATVSAA